MSAKTLGRAKRRETRARVEAESTLVSQLTPELRRKMYGYALSLTACEALADDITQEALVYLWRNPKRIPRWGIVVRSRAVDALRARGLVSGTRLDNLPDDEVTELQL